ncbi:MAG: flavodoxin [Cytophagales bacterium]|nr:MAG: flavodoxin [Cytophagales bacterium]TAF61909.1 MAG: flavodoxin [Cytophagales bacterium]
MSKIGLFFGTDTGNTENIALRIQTMLGKEHVDVHNLAQKEAADVLEYSFLIFGAPTWYDGELQTDWEELLPQFKELDFTGKKVAIFGLGDQWGYGEWFVDAIGIIADVITAQGGQLVGCWSTEGYDYEASKGARGDVFLGLAIDEDNQPELTNDRLKQWVPQVLQEFGFQVAQA